MKKYRVNISNGKNNAPYPVVEAINEVEAVKEAKEISGLSRFKNLEFTAIELKD